MSTPDPSPGQPPAFSAMRSMRRRNSWRLPTRRLVAGAALLAYLAVGVGVPLPVPPIKNHTQPFPCQDHPCGCQTAEQCWRHCCCFTPEERLAWARAHGVEPPPYAERPAEGGWHTARLRDRDSAPPPAPGYSHCARAPGKGSCCGPDSDRGPETKPSTSPGVRWRSHVGALRCGGLATFWLTTGAILPPALLTWAPSLTLAGRVAERAAAAAHCSPEPPIPPPRRQAP
jgi:hypothetical protein